MPATERRAKILQYLVYGLLGIVVLAVITGRIHWLGAVAAGALAFAKFGASTFMRLLPFLQMGQRAGLFKNPMFRTEHIEFTLDVKSGAITGQVLSGEHAGKNLNELSSQEIETLRQSLEAKDKRAWHLLGIYLQRRQGKSHNNKADNANQYNSQAVAAPSVEEAILILGLPEEFDKKDLNYAYKRLMQKLHPDRGGNEYLASRVNLARDVLTNHLNNKNT